MSFRWLDGGGIIAIIEFISPPSDARSVGQLQAGGCGNYGAWGAGEVDETGEKCGKEEELSSRGEVNCSQTDQIWIIWKEIWTSQCFLKVETN